MVGSVVSVLARAVCQLTVKPRSRLGRWGEELLLDSSSSSAAAAARTLSSRRGSQQHSCSHSTRPNRELDGRTEFFLILTHFSLSGPINTGADNRQQHKGKVGRGNKSLKWLLRFPKWVYKWNSFYKLKNLHKKMGRGGSTPDPNRQPHATQLVIVLS